MTSQIGLQEKDALPRGLSVSIPQLMRGQQVLGLENGRFFMA